jgi:hypothetical protein
MLKTVLAFTLAAGCCLNTWAAIAADAAQPQPQDEKLTSTSQAIPRIPACWIVPVSCR